VPEPLISINRLDSLACQIEADREARLRAIHALEKRLKESETDRQARLEMITRLDTALFETTADRTAHLQMFQTLEAAWRRSEEDLVAQRELIERLETNSRELVAAQRALMYRLQIALNEAQRRSLLGRLLRAGKALVRKILVRARTSTQKPPAAGGKAA
jgi:hypothetical protein